MEGVQAIGGGSFLLVMTVLGFRLLFLAWRNRAIPELLLALAFLFGGSLGATVEAVASATAEQMENAGSLVAVGKVFGLVGMLTNCLFIWWVFRRHDGWAWGVVSGVMALQISGFVGHWLGGTFETAVQHPTWFWVELAGRLASPIWLGIEAFVYWQRMRRRVALGLADPVLCNRFALWALASAFGVVCLLTSVPPLFLEAGHPLLDLDMLLFGVFGVLTAASYWLAFFPPAAYRRWLVESAPTTA